MIVEPVQAIVVSCRACGFGQRAPLFAIVHGAEATRIKLPASHKQLKESNLYHLLVAKLRQGKDHYLVTTRMSNPQYVCRAKVSSSGCRCTDMTVHVEILFTKMSTPR